MKHFYAALLPALLLLPAAAGAQTAGSVGIGTNTPDAKAALDINSTDKGLLIPRLTQAKRTAMGTTGLPAGLMVFQTDGAQPGFWYFFGGQWLALPSQQQAGDNLGNHTATQNLRLNGNWLSNDGGDEGLRINNIGNVGIGLTNPGSRFRLQVAGGDTRLAAAGAAQSLFGVRRVVGLNDLQFFPNDAGSGTPALRLTTDNGTIVYGNATFQNLATFERTATFQNQVNMGWTMGSIDDSFPGNSRGFWTVSCPSGMRLLGGGGGHRDYNSAATDIVVNYSGPDPDAPETRWRVILDNNSGSSRAVRFYCICARMAP